MISKEAISAPMKSTSDKRTAMLVDGYPMWLDAIEAVAERAGIHVISKLTSSRAALESLPALRPDLLVTGNGEGEGEIDGLTLVTRAVEADPGLRIVVLSSYDDQEHIDAAFAAGAQAYVLKSAHAIDLISAFRQAFKHSIYLAGGRPAAPVAPREMHPVIGESSGGQPAVGLTPRELEILRLVAEGHSNAQLARTLWVTQQTVKFHLTNIYRKLGVANRTEASRWAQLNGLLPTSAGMPRAA